MSEILVPVSFGELLDKIAILQIKSERMSDPAKLAHVRDELAALEKTWLAHPVAGHDIAELRARLKAVNERLWVIEDEVRLKEKAQAFDDDFVRLARSVYIENDERARIEMHLEATRAVAFEVEGRGFAMAAGETIHTEYSHKFTVDGLRALAVKAGSAARAASA